jgi:hypothetical protein
MEVRKSDCRGWNAIPFVDEYGEVFKLPGHCGEKVRKVSWQTPSVNNLKTTE